MTFHSSRFPGFHTRTLLWAVLPAAVALLVALVGSAPAPAAGEKLSPRPEVLVSGDWLQARLGEPAVRPVDLRERPDYEAGHVPGAVHLPLRMLFRERGGVTGMLPPVDEVTAALRARGIGADTVVVAYDDRNGLWAARLFWVLDYLGQGRGRVLDGGWPLWRQRGRPVSEEAPRVPAGNLQPRPQPALIADLAWVRAHLEDADVRLVDARSPREYTGQVRYADRGGHIPGAVNLEWKRHLRPDGTLKSRAALLEAYEALGVVPGKEIVVYCQVMARAAHSYFVLRWLGFPRVRGYDGSWAEWGNREDTPVATERPYGLPLGRAGGRSRPATG